jgi:hypothetical protein
VTNNYLKEIDLSPTVGGPINNPYDPRAHHDFCFESDSQEVILIAQQQTGVATPFRVFISYDCGHLELITPTPLPVPFPGTGPGIHGVLRFDPNFGFMQPEENRVFRRLCCKLSRHIKVWLDPASPITTTQPIPVQVSASRRGDGPACGCSD